MSTNDERVLITGVSGFIGAHCALEFLRAGYKVRGTMRDLARADSIRSMLATHYERAGDERAGEMEFAAATLTDGACWGDAVRGCDAVIHVASPVPVEQPRDPDEVIVPARDGALNVLAAARDAGIRRVVLTSSVAAATGPVVDGVREYDDTIWTDISRPGVSPYAISKTVAERAARDFCAEQGAPELVTVNPSVVLGPALERDYGASLTLLVALLSGRFPLAPKLCWGIVDVRDVATLHRLALESPAAAGQRYICSAGTAWTLELAEILRDAFPAYAGKLPKRRMPDWLMRIVGKFDAQVRQFLPSLGVLSRYDAGPATRDLGWQPRSIAEATTSGAQSLIDVGAV